MIDNDMEREFLNAERYIHDVCSGFESCDECPVNRVCLNNVTCATGDDYCWGSTPDLWDMGRLEGVEDLKA